MPRLSRILTLSVCAAALACSVSAGSQIPCADDASCPTDYPVCDGANPGKPGVCIAQDATHVSSRASVSIVGVQGREAGAVVRGKVQVVVAARAASGVGAVTLSGGGRSFTQTAATPPSWAFDVDTSALGDGSLSLTAAVTPGDGSPAVTSAPFALAYDNTPPSLTLVALAPAQAAPGRVVTLDLTASEPLGALSATLSLNGSVAGDLLRADPPAGSSSRSYRLVYPITALTAAGSYTIAVTAQDLAGNLRADALGAQVFTVRQPFSLDGLTVEGAVLSPAAGTIGKPINVTLKLPASVDAAAPVFTLTDAAGQARVFSAPAAHFDASGERTWTAADAVLATDAPGLAQVTATVTDAAGNSASLSRSYLIDEAPAALSGAAAARPVIDVLTGPQIITAWSSKPLAAAAVTTSSGDAGTCTFDSSSIPVAVTCTIAVADASSRTPVAATLRLTDLAGNVSPATDAYRARYSVVPLPAAPSITLGAAAITAGTSTTLAPAFSNGTGSISGLGPVAAGATYSVSPLASTTYTLTVTNAAGSSVTAAQTLTVVPPPAIASFGAALETLTTGNGTTLSATFSGGTGRIDPGGLLISSGVPLAVRPAASTTYTLTVTNPATAPASVAAQARVTVVPAPAIAAFVPLPAIITRGDTATLTPSFTNGTGAVDHGLGAVTSGPALTVSPTQSTTYRLTVTDAAGDATSSLATITVVDAPTAALAAGDAVITRGASTTLTPVFTAGTAAIDQGVGLAVSGAPLTVSPIATTTYTLTVTNAAGRAIAAARTVAVVDPVGTPTLVAGASVIPVGGSTTLLATFTGGSGGIDQGVGAVTSGAVLNVAPAQTTTYTLTVANAATTPMVQTAQVTVHVAPAIPSFAAAPAIISAGSSSVLSASFTGGTGVVSPGNLALASGGSLNVSPSSSTVYTLSVTGPDGVVSTARAAVSVVPVPSIAGFTSGATSITAGLATTLSATFAAGQTASIDHGVGAVTSGQIVAIAPASSTTYTLTVTNAAGDTTQATASVSVLAAPSIASFGASALTISAGDTVQLLPVFGSGTATIDHGAGAATSGAAIPVSPASTTTYTLTVSNAATAPASVTATVTVTVLALPVAASLTASRTTITAGDTITLTPVFANGTAAIDHGVGALSTGAPITVAPGVTTAFTLTVTNPLGRTATAAVTVTVLAAPSIASFASTTPTVDASATTLSFSAVFANGTGVLTPGGASIQSGVTRTLSFTPPAAPATVTYTLTVTNAQGASATGTAIVHVVPNASAALTAAAATITAGASTTLTPVFGAGQTGVIIPGGIPAVSGQPVTVSPAADTTYTLTVTDTGGGQTTASATVHVVAAPAIAGFAATPGTTDAAHAVSLLATFSGGAGVINPGGLAVTSGQAISVSPSSTTTYTLSVGNAATLPAFAAAQVQVTVLPLPVATSLIASATSIVAGQTATLTPTFANGFAAIDNGVGSAASGTALTVAPITTTTYTLTVTDALGSTATASATIAVVAIAGFATTTPTVDSSSAGVSFTASFSGGTGRIDPGAIAVTSGVPVSGALPASTTPYTLTVTNALGFSTTAGATVQVVALPSAALAASPPTITAGAASRLTATFPAGQTGSIAGLGPVASGTAVAVSPAATASYTLTVQNAAGHSATASAGVTVVAAPAIASFAASASSVPSGGAFTLSYAGSGGTGSISSAALSSAIAATGAGTANVTAPTALVNTQVAYTLAVTNAAGTVASQTVTILVTPLPTASLTFQDGSTAATVSAHQNVTLLPAFANGTGSINGIPVTSGTALTINDLVASTAFTLSVTSPSGASASAAVTATVRAQIDGFTSSQLYFKQGTTPAITLTALFEGSGAAGNAPASINDGTHSISISRGVAITVNPTVTTTYTLTVTGTGAANTATRALTIAALPTPPAALTASASTLTAGQSLTLTPTFAGAGLTGVITNTLDTSAIAVTSGVGVQVFPAATTVYLLTVTNLAGDTANASAPVTVISAPAAPGNVVAVAGIRSASLTWTAPASNGSPIAGYLVFQSLNGGAYVESAAAVSGASASVSGLQNGGAYTFAVAATNAVGTGSSSAPSATVTLADVPAAPVITSVSGGDSQATITITAPVSNGGSPITGFTVIASPGGASVSGSTTTAVVTGLNNGTAYTFTAVATNAAGTGAASAVSASVTPAAKPAAPTAVSAVAAVGSANLTWAAPFNGGSAITGYTVLQSISGGAYLQATATVSGTTALVTGLANAAQVQFEIIATNALGAGPASAPSASITLPDLPGAPFGVVAAAGNGQATISWSAPASTGGSAVTRYTVTATPGAANATTTGATTVTVPGLTNGAAYTFTVTATNSVGTGAPSPASNPITPATNPGAPTAVAATAGVRSASISWTAPAANGSPIYSYQVLQSLNGGAFGAATASTLGTTASVSGLVNGGSYRFEVVALNGVGASPASAASAAVVLPDLPGAPAIIAVNAGDQQATLTWSAAAANGAAITGYTVTSAPGNVLATTNGALTATVLLLTNGTPYTFTVTATNAAGTGAASAASAPVTPAGLPTAPANVVATAGIRSAGLSWTAAAANGSALTAYNVFQSLNGGAYTPSAAAVSGLTAAVSGLQNGGSYTFQVSATNGVGTGALSPASGSITLADLPGAPTAVSAVAGSAQATVSFAAPATDGGSAITKYTVTSNPGGVAATTTGATTAVVTGLSNGTPYTFTVVATNAAGDGPASAASAPVTPIPAVFPRFAYVTNYNDSSVSFHVVDAATGRLRYSGKAATGQYPLSVTVVPSGKFAFVASAGAGSGGIRPYAIAANGNLTPVGAPVAVGTYEYGVTTDPSGKYLYALDYTAFTVSQYAIGAAGSLTAIAAPVATGQNPNGIAITPSGKFAFIANVSTANISAYSIGADGSLTALGNTACGAGPAGIAIDPSGRYLYVSTNANNVAQFAIGGTGALTPLAPATVAAGNTPGHIAVDPTGRYAYLADSADNTVSQYAIGANGALSPLAPATVATGAYPFEIAIEPTGQFVYTTNLNDNTVSQFAIGAGGRLAPVNPGSVAQGNTPRGIAIAQGLAPLAAAPQYAYVANNGDNSVSAYAVDAATGRFKALGRINTGSGPESVAVDPSGKYAYVTNYNAANVFQYAVLPNGALSANGALGAGTNPRGITIDPSGKYVYVANDTSGNVSQYSIVAGGNLLAIGAAVAAGANPHEVTVEPSGRFAYVPNYGSNSVSQYSIGANGALSPLGTPATTGAGPIHTAVDPSGRYLYVTNTLSNNVSQFAIGANGTLTEIAARVAAGAGAYGIAVDPSARYVYVTNDGAGTVSQYLIGANGSLTAMAVAAVAAGPNARGVSVDPSGKYVSVASFGSNAVFQFSIGAGGGLVPAPLAQLAGPAGPWELTMTQGTAPLVATPRFAYVANHNDSTVSQYAIAAGGGLAPLATPTVSAGLNVPSGLTTDPTGRYAYAANTGGDSISQYAIGADGSLSMIGAAVASAHFPESIAVDPSGRFAYAACIGGAGAVSQYLIGPNGSLSPMAAASVANAGANSVVIDPSGRYAYVADYGNNTIAQYTLGGSGALSPMAPPTVAAGATVYSVIIDPSGRYVYAANYADNTVSQFAVGAAGGLTAIGAAVASGTGPTQLAVDPAGSHVYVANSGSNNVSQYAIGADGSLTVIAAAAGVGLQPQGVSVDPSGKYLYVTGAGSNFVSQLSIGADGSLAPLNPATVASGANPIPVAAVGAWQ